MNSSYGFNLLNLGNFLSPFLVIFCCIFYIKKISLTCKESYLLGSNSYSVLVVRSKRYSFTGNTFEKLRIPMYGLPDHVLCRKIKKSNFEYVSAEIGSAILQYRYNILLLLHI